MKAEDYRKMSDDELSSELEALRMTLFSLRTKAVTDVLEKSHQLRQARRDIARVQTVLTERQRTSQKGKAPV